jgi:hypothetical protein
MAPVLPLTEEYSADLGLNPHTRWAWYNVPIQGKPIYRQLPDGSAWVIEAFRGLELGRFTDKDRAIAAWTVLHGKARERL